MKINRRSSVLLASIGSLVILGYFAYVHQNQIAARLWHWRHGYTTRVGGYEVPVPENWLVLRSTDSTMIDLVDTHMKRTSDSLSNANIISVDVLSRAPRDLNAWRSFTRESLTNRGLEDVQEKSLKVGDETVVCLGGQQLRALTHLPTATVSLECQSSGRLNLMFSGHQSGVNEFYTLLTQVHKLPTD